MDLRHRVGAMPFRVRTRKVVGTLFDPRVATGAQLSRLGYADELEPEADRQGMFYAAPRAITRRG